jgi:hypothetical protein
VYVVCGFTLRVVELAIYWVLVSALTGFWKN